MAAFLILSASNEFVPRALPEMAEIILAFALCRVPAAWLLSPSVHFGLRTLAFAATWRLPAGPITRVALERQRAPCASGWYLEACQRGTAYPLVVGVSRGEWAVERAR